MQNTFKNDYISTRVLEYRMFIFNGKVLISDNYWNEYKEVNVSDDLYTWIESAGSKIESHFARKTDSVI